MVVTTMVVGGAIGYFRKRTEHAVKGLRDGKRTRLSRTEDARTTDKHVWKKRGAEKLRAT